MWFGLLIVVVLSCEVRSLYYIVVGKVGYNFLYKKSFVKIFFYYNIFMCKVDLEDLIYLGGVKNFLKN